MQSLDLTEPVSTADARNPVNLVIGRVNIRQLASFSRVDIKWMKIFLKEIDR